MSTESASLSGPASAALVSWLARLPEGTRDWLRARMQPMTLPGGAVLFQAGDASDALYVVVSGCLGAFAPHDLLQPVGQVVAGETVGETGLITGRPRSASVRALRDSELLRVDRSVFDDLAQRDPAALLSVARLALDRVVAPPSQQRNWAGPRTLAILPQHEGLDARVFADALGRALSRYGSHVVLDAASARQADLAYFSNLERAHRFVLYVADEGQTEWRELCLRQADALLFYADADTQPAPWSELLRGLVAPLPRPEHLVLRHGAPIVAGSGKRWTKWRPQARLHHARALSDAPRIARLICGRALSLVLSGGGARGFAHLGAIKALREHGIVIDAVGGTSIGAIMGAAVAADWSFEEMVDVFRRSFVITNPLSDYTIPFVSMVSGRKVSRLLREAFGERGIEDLPLPFFAVSANLTDGKVAVHRSGPLWQWLRASVAIPGVLPPVFHRGQVFVDGGVINNLPVDIMRESHRGEIVAVDIGGDHAVAAGQGVEEFDLPPLWRMVTQWFTGRRRPSILKVLLRAGMVNSGSAAGAARAASTMLIAPQLDGIDLLEWKSFERAIEIGYEHTQRVIGRGPSSLSTDTHTL
jgi:NTE family protein